MRGGAGLREVEEHFQLAVLVHYAGVAETEALVEARDAPIGWYVRKAHAVASRQRARMREDQPYRLLAVAAPLVARIGPERVAFA